MNEDSGIDGEPRKVSTPFGAMHRRRLLERATTITAATIAGAKLGPYALNAVIPTSPRSDPYDSGDIANPDNNPVIQHARLVPVFLGNWENQADLRNRILKFIKAFDSRDTDGALLQVINSYGNAGRIIELESPIFAKNLTNDLLEKYSQKEVPDDELVKLIENFMYAVNRENEEPVFTKETQPVFFFPPGFVIPSGHFQAGDIAYAAISYPEPDLLEFQREQEKKYGLPLLRKDVPPTPEDLMNHWYGVAISHEVMEMLTNPYPANRAWTTKDNSEIGDLCQFRQIAINTEAGPVTLQAAYSEADHACKPRVFYGFQRLDTKYPSDGQAEVAGAATGAAVSTGATIVNALADRWRTRGRKSQQENADDRSPT